jgi:hypothetical protein
MIKILTELCKLVSCRIFKHWENNVQYLMDFIGTTNVLLDKLIILTTGWFGWYKSRLVSAESIVFCERE